MSSEVYIAASSATHPPLISAVEAINHLYPLSLCPARTNTLARRAARGFGINSKALCMDVDRIPQTVLANPDHHPVAWSAALINELSSSIPISDIGFLGVAYNTSYHTSNLPNLACQVALKCGVNLDAAPEETSNYGCAGGLFALEKAIHYCQTNRRAAVVVVFDQCTSKASFCYDSGNPMFKMDLKVNLLFSDGAVALLLVPECMKGRFPTIARIEDMTTGFHLSDMIRFKDSRFVLGDRIRDEVPPIVANSVIKPLLAKHALQTSDIEEWSVHQGSRDILREFTKPAVLGLTEEQIDPSLQEYERLGNLSAPSCFMVFNGFVAKKSSAQSGMRGMIVGFGAGFYQSALLYKWI